MNLTSFCSVCKDDFRTSRSWISCFFSPSCDCLTLFTERKIQRYVRMRNKDVEMLHGQEDPKLTPAKSVDSFSSVGLRFSTTFNPSWKKLDGERVFEKWWSFQRTIRLYLFIYLFGFVLIFVKKKKKKGKNVLALGVKIFDEVLHQVDPLPDFDFIHFDEILKRDENGPLSLLLKAYHGWLKGEARPLPHTSGAERPVSLFPSPQQSLLHWSPSWSSRAAWHAPASLSRSYYYTAETAHHHATQASSL